MIVSKKLNQQDANIIKNYIMASYRFCKRVFDNGIETQVQFQTFTKLCQNHLNICNYWCYKFKPTFKWIRYKKKYIYSDLMYACEYTVMMLDNMLTECQTVFDKQAEEAEAIAQIELRSRIEHELALEYKDAINAKAKSQSKLIGFKYIDD